MNNLAAEILTAILANPHATEGLARDSDSLLAAIQNQLDDKLKPFIAVARGIPHNWPGDAILRFGQRNDSTLYLDYYKVGDAHNGITVDQWRALRR